MRFDLAGFGRGGRDMAHRDMLALCELAERLGFSGIWFNQFHFREPPQAYSSTLLLASSIFARTERLRVGTSILVTPLYHPFLLAEETAQLHWQSGGRLDLGVGRGTHPDVFSRLGIPEHRSRPRFEQSLDLLRAAWTGKAAMPAGGEWPACDTPVGPFLETGEIPLYVAGTTPETLALAARRKLPLLLSLEPPETGQLAAYRDILARENLPSRLASSSLSRFVVVAPSRARALEKLDALLPKLVERRTAAARARGRDVSATTPPSPERFMAAQAIVGDPGECRAQLAALERDTGIGAVRLVFNANGVIDTEEARADMTLFGREIIGA